MFVNRPLIFLIAGALCVWLPARAQSVSNDSSEERWSIHFQATSIGQHHGSFPSLYSGENSLPSHSESRVSLTATVFLAYRVNSWTELVFDPELAGGKGFGQVTGIAGFTNGEIPRVASATPTPYVARAYVKNTWALSEDSEMVEGGANQLAGSLPVCRFTMVTGKFAITDYFDNNSYSHDPRRQFMNWSLMSNGAWDYPADTRGYTVGTVQELTMRGWSLRAAAVMEPTEANGATFDTRLAKNRGVAVEWEKRYRPLGHAGALRVLGFENRERAGTFRDAMLAGRRHRSGGHAPPRHQKIRFRLERGAGDHQRYRSLRAIRLERRQDRDVGFHSDRPLRQRGSLGARTPLEASRRYRRPGSGAELSVRRRSQLSCRGRRGLHHRRRQAELCAGVDYGSLLFLARGSGLDVYAGLPAGGQPGL